MMSMGLRLQAKLMDISATDFHGLIFIQVLKKIIVVKNILLYQTTFESLKIVNYM